MLILTPFSKKSDSWFATISATTIEASVVEAAMWGDKITFGLLNKIFSFAGSFEKTSTAVDVFSKEPAKENILFNNPKVILSPHIAASTTEASIVVAEMVANQLSDFLLKGVKINTV